MVWFLFPVSMFFLGHAFWRIYGKRQGAPWTRWIVWVSAVLVVILWLQRLGL